MAKKKPTNKKKKQQVVKKSKAAPKTSPAILKVWNFIEEKGKGFALGLIAILGFLVFRNYLTFQDLYLFRDIGSDSINAVHPKFTHLADYIREYGLPKWSFNQGMGQNIFPYSLGDPFYWIQYILGRNGLPYGYAYVEYFKILISCTIIFAYFKTLNYKNYVAIFGALFFCFSGFMILGGGWLVFSTQALHASLLLLALERLISQKSYWMLPIPILLIAASQPFNLFLFSQFILAYVVFRHIDQQGWNGIALFKQLLSIFFLGVIGVGLSSFFLFSNIQELLQSPRVSGESSFFATLMEKPIFSLETGRHYTTALLRFFSSDLLGTGSEFKGWRNYLEAPIFYIGIPTLLLFPQVFVGLSSRKKILYATPLIVAFIAIVFPFFRYSFWAYSGDYYRAFSLFAAMIVMLMAVKVLQNYDSPKRLSIPVLLGTATVLLLLLSYSYSSNSQLINSGLMGFIAVLIILYTALLGMSVKGMMSIKTALLAMMAILCFEVVYLSSITVNNRTIVTSKEFKQKIDYNDATIDAVKFIDEKDKGFFRVHKNYSSGGSIHGSLNDGKIQGFRGTASYYSFNQKYYIEFLQAVGVIDGKNESQTRWAPGLASRPLLEIYASVKYKILKANGGKVNGGFGFNKIKDISDVTVFENSNYLSLGFGHQKFLTRSRFDQLSRLAKEVALFRSVIIDDEDASTYANLGMQALDTNSLPKADNDYTGQTLQTDLNALKAAGLQLGEHNQNYISGTVNFPAKRTMSFTIPYDIGWKAFVDGVETPVSKVNIGFLGFNVDAGEHKIELRFFPTLVWPGFLTSLVFLGLYGLLLFYLRKKQTRQPKKLL